MGKSSEQAVAVKPAEKDTQKDQAKSITTVEPAKDLAAEHLPPLGLVFTVIACSGILFMFAFRDVFATGRNIAGDMDEAYLQYTKSVDFFNDKHGWKSTQGGLSTILPKTTDANNMGGLFVRKIGGAAAMAVQFQKLFPLLVHPFNARWKHGHFRPLLWTSLFANAALAAFYSYSLPEMTAAGADYLPSIFMALLLLESTVIYFYLSTTRKIKLGPAKAMTDGKTPSSVPSRIIARTIAFCSSVVVLVAGRDLFFPGEILDFLPRDDVYLEWTNAFFHSPPEGTVEAEVNGLASALNPGDKFLSQFMALNLLLLTAFKCTSAFFIRYGSDGSGEIKARMMWKTQFLGNALILFLFRLFASSAKSASLDIQWHVMLMAYETGMLVIYGFL